jgi:prepilin-type N-terminal cleavage/methylation domain-containing protein
MVNHISKLFHLGHKGVKMKRINKQKGFSLIEMIIALSLLLVLIAATQPIIGRLIDFRSNILTDTNINSLGDAVEEWYSENAWDFGQVTNSSLPLPGGGNMVHNSGTRSAGWERLAQRYAGSSRYTQDGFNHGFRVYISNPLTQEYRGVLVPYHVIALVSSGGEGEAIGDKMVSRVNSVFNQGNGGITVNDNESVYIINGFSIQKEMIDTSIERLNRIARSYENFYRLQFVTQEREPAINYFARNGGNTRWDISSPVVARCGGSGDTIMGNNQLGHDINTYGLLNAIGVSTEAAQSAWGEGFRLLNCGSTSSIRVRGANRTFSARTPNSPAGNNTPPYSAILGFHLPNAETYTTTVTSSF